MTVPLLNLCFRCYRKLSRKSDLLIPLRNHSFRATPNRFEHLSLLQIRRLRTSFTPPVVWKIPFRSILTESEYLEAREKAGGRRMLKYMVSVVMFAGSLTYASVPLYRKFCQAQGAGFAVAAKDVDKIEAMSTVKKRLIKVRFSSDVFSSLQWKFRPLQDEVYVHPGETALAFYTAQNTTDVPVVGISTYSVTPFTAGAYFAKIQCFCFEEQLLNPGEEVDMPVFFYIDPDYADDAQLEDIDELLLHYTFFESKDGLNITLPQQTHKLPPPQEECPIPSPTFEARN